MDDFIVLPTSRGSICGTKFGIGVDLDGTYTPNDILETGFKLKSMIKTETEPYWIDTFNNYSWIPWSRLNHQYCQAVRHRTMRDSKHNLEASDLTRYLGIGDYVSVWPIYIPTASRIQALSAHFTSMQGLRVLELGCGCGHQLLPLAAHGCDVYGMELNPSLFGSRHPLLRDRIQFGDALIDPWLMYNQDSFNVIIVSMIGFVNYSDLLEFFTGLAHILRKGVLIVDLVKHNSGTGSIRPFTSYKEPLRIAGFSPKHVICDQLVCLASQAKLGA